MKKLLIVGDSFSCSSSPDSWIDLLQDWNITNMSSNGSSQYRIYKKISSIQIQNFDANIIVHTSPNRIFVKNNPLYKSHKTHSDCDLLYTDLEDKKGIPYADSVLWWFENVFDLDQAQDLCNLMIEDCIKKTSSAKSIHLTFFDLNHPKLLNLYHIWKKYPGTINHLNKDGNQVVASLIQKMLG